MKSKLKLAAITFAAFSAGTYVQFLYSRKEHDGILKEVRRRRYIDGYREGWMSALNDAPSIKLAHSRMTRLMTSEYSLN